MTCKVCEPICHLHRIMKFIVLCLVHLTVVNLMGFVSGGFSQRVREKVLDSAKVVAAPNLTFACSTLATYALDLFPGYLI